VNSKHIFLLILIGIIAYIPSLFGQFVWDDEDFVSQNAYVATHQYQKFFTAQAIEGRGKQSNYYRPIQMSLYAAIHTLAGFNPHVYHAVNVIIHTAAAVSVYIFFTILLHASTLAFLPSLIFLIHPLQTEAVSYISGLSDPLVALFGFLSLTLFLKSNDRLIFLPLSLFFFILSLLSKEIGLAFLGILALLVIFKKRPYISLLPFFLISLLYLLFHVQSINVLDMAKVWGPTPYAANMPIRIATFSQNIFYYLGLYFFPKNLHMERDLTTPMQYSLINPYSIVLLMLTIGACLYFWKTRKEEKTLLTIFSLLSFFLTLLPYSGIFLINGIFYEHFLYIPIAFLSLFLMITIQQWNNKTICLIICCLLLTRSYLRQYDWLDPIRFYTQTLSFAPESIRIRNGLGMAYADAKQYGKALATFDEIIVRDPHLPNSYHNKGNIYLTQGNSAEAEKAFKKALDVDPSFTFSVLALYDLYRKSNQPEKLTELKKSYPNILY
jgi:hypothetical protein